MTVQELINELQQVKNKNLQIVVRGTDPTDWIYNNEVEGISEENVFYEPAFYENDMGRKYMGKKLQGSKILVRKFSLRNSWGKIYSESISAPMNFLMDCH